MNQKRIAIIGAGMSGLAAAQTLQAAGVQVQIFDKARGPGGRMTSKRGAQGYLDLGAQYFTARDPEFQAKVAKWQAQGWVQPWSFVPYTYQHGQLRATPDQQVRFIGTQNMHHLIKAELQDIDCQFNSQITELQAIIENQAGNPRQRWQLCDATGNLFGLFDAVILTCPPEQARVLLQGSDLATHIPTGALLPCWAVMLELNSALEPSVAGIFVKEGPASWIACHSKKPGRQTELTTRQQWLVHFSPEFTQSHLESSATQIAELAAQTLSEVLQQQIDVHTAISHRWLYASYNLQTPPCGVLHDKRWSLAVCGDWTLGGRVENAWLSGVSAAKIFLQD